VGRLNRKNRPVLDDGSLPNSTVAATGERRNSYRPGKVEGGGSRGRDGGGGKLTGGTRHHGYLIRGPGKEKKRKKKTGGVGNPKGTRKFDVTRAGVAKFRASKKGEMGRRLLFLKENSLPEAGAAKGGP